MKQDEPTGCTIGLEFMPNPGRYPKIPNTIFVSIASYRDDECSDTINDIFNQASRPNDVYVGVVQQNKKKREDCFDRCLSCSQRKQAGNIRVKNFSHLQAKGPTFARYHCSTLWRGEEFYLQIDSHCKFEKGWDDTLLQQMRATNDPKAVVGAYPPTKEQMDTMRKSPHAIQMCNGAIDSEGMPTIAAEMRPVQPNAPPSPSFFMSAGLMCMPGTALHDVPFDPYLSYLFFGEEVLFSARLWTAGYNMYAPSKHFCTHHYTRKNKPKYWQDHRRSEHCRKHALRRAKYLLGLMAREEVHPDYTRILEGYGMGTARPLASFWALAGIKTAPDTGQLAIKNKVCSGDDKK